MLRGGARAARAHARRLRDGADAAGLRARACAAARERVRAREQLRAALEAFERLGAQPWADQAAGRAGGDGRDRAAARREHARRAHAAGAADRAAARRRPDDARGGRGALPQPEDRRVPPAQRLPQARHPLARGARGELRRVRPRAPSTNSSCSSSPTSSSTRITLAGGRTTTKPAPCTRARSLACRISRIPVESMNVTSLRSSTSCVAAAQLEAEQLLESVVGSGEVEISRQRQDDLRAETVCGDTPSPSPMRPALDDEHARICA